MVYEVGRVLVKFCFEMCFVVYFFVYWCFFEVLYIFDVNGGIVFDFFIDFL